VARREEFGLVCRGEERSQDKIAPLRSWARPRRGGLTLGDTPYSETMHLQFEGQRYEGGLGVIDGWEQPRQCIAWTAKDFKANRCHRAVI
jgi:hypothetical protein